jgi:hypothetical protein
MLRPDGACKYATRSSNREEKSEDHQDVGGERLGQFSGVPKWQNHDLLRVLDQASESMRSGSRKFGGSFDLSRPSAGAIRHFPVKDCWSAAKFREKSSGLLQFGPLAVLIASNLESR